VEKLGQTLNKDLKDYMKAPPLRGLTANPEFLHAATEKISQDLKMSVKFGPSSYNGVSRASSVKSKRKLSH